MAIISAKDQLVALFNAKNPNLAIPLTSADIDFGAVSAVTPSTNYPHTARITITAKTASPNFQGEKTLYYYRLPASVLVGAKNLSANQADWDTDEEVLAKFNAHVIEVGRTEDEFALSELTITRETGEDGKEIITVTIKAGHIKYIEGVAAVYTITNDSRVDLATTNGELDGYSI